MASSRFLEQRLVDVAEVPQVRCIVELGPGTGGTTQSLLAAMDHSATLLAIELIPSLARQLKTIEEPRLVVEQADAVELRNILTDRRLPQPDRIISGIPFSALKPEQAQRLMQQIYELLAPGGYFIAYQVRNVVVSLAEPYFGPGEMFREYRNVPPLKIYRWRKHAGDGCCQRRAVARKVLGTQNLAGTIMT
ncbi:MAG: methyltransferase domain-containing protein [Pirellulaceae bacterium]|nr:methyltransferase domain-containing protein [Pirellulaceae bacterium]